MLIYITLFHTIVIISIRQLHYNMHVITNITIKLTLIRSKTLRHPWLLSCLITALPCMLENKIVGKIATTFS